MKIGRLILFILLLVNHSFCVNAAKPDLNAATARDPLVLGAERFDVYMPMLEGKNVGLTVNHTSLVGHPATKSHLVDTLIRQGVQVKTIFTPEHGFRGKADAGEAIGNDNDPAFGIPIVSLYGKTKKPEPKHLEGLDVVIFDIQDVGARFYTYISTMHYVMEACAEQGIPVIVLDRPNPNGFYVDGPVLEPAYRSFVGMHPVPIVHGMTVGEYAQMINGEGWLAEGIKCDLTVVPCLGYNHEQSYRLREKPSPNLPNMTSIYLYPSLCFFEGTIMSIGRGTDFPFQVVGHPDYAVGTFEFTPQSVEGAKSPKLEGELCKGFDFRDKEKGYFYQQRKLNLSWLLVAYRYFDNAGKADDFFNIYFNKLAGNGTLKQQIKDGFTENMIRESWNEGLSEFNAIRQKHLLYQDFNR